MNKKVTLKAKETSATNSDFYNLFRPIAPSIDIIGKVAQVVSALTEAVTIWYITQSEMQGASKMVSIVVSVVAMLLVIGVLELGGRKFLQVLTRAIIWKRLKNAWYIALFVIVSGVTIGMGVLSFNLSTNGIHHAFTSNVPTVAQFDDGVLKQELRNNIQEVSTRFEKDLTIISDNHGSRITGLSEQYDARIASMQSKVDQYNRKFNSGLKWAKSQSEKYQKKVVGLEAEKRSKIAGLQTEHAKKLDQWQSKKDKAIAKVETRFDQATENGQTALVKVHASKSKKANFWGSLFSFFVGFSVILAFICIISVEVYRRGSGIEVTYEEEEKDQPILLLFWKGLTTRLDQFFRKRAERFAKVSSSARVSTSNTIGFNPQRSFAVNESSPIMNGEEDIE